MSAEREALLRLRRYLHERQWEEHPGPGLLRDVDFYIDSRYPDPPDPSPSLSRPMPLEVPNPLRVAQMLRNAVAKALDADNDTILLGTGAVAQVRTLDPKCELLSESFNHANGVLGIHQAWRVMRALERRAHVDQPADRSDYAFTTKLSDYGTPGAAAHAPMFDMGDMVPRFQRGPDLVDYGSFVRERDLVNRWVSAAVNASGRLCPVERTNPEEWAKDQTAYILGLLDRIKALAGVQDRNDQLEQGLADLRSLVDALRADLKQ